MPSPLIDVADLTALLDGDHPPVLLDVRWQLGAGPGHDRYLAGHLPGARFVDLDADLAAGPGSGGRHPLPDAADFAATMRRLGVRNDTAVVVYDAGNATSAARAWWLLRRFGHRDVRVLDGGYAAWVAAGRPVQTGEVDSEVDGGAHGGADGSVGDFRPAPGAAQALEVDAVLPFTEQGLLLDARDRERYLGDVEPVDPVAGHIPGAVSAPTKENVTAEGTFRDPAALRERFAALGATPGRPVAVYCGSGVTAAHEVLALEVAGLTAALYPGSWSHWITDPSRPVATGRE